jgi:hypothetical protein
VILEWYVRPVQLLREAGIVDVGTARETFKPEPRARAVRWRWSAGERYVSIVPLPPRLAELMRSCPAGSLGSMEAILTLHYPDVLGLCLRVSTS